MSISIVFLCVVPCAHCAWLRMYPAVRLSLSISVSYPNAVREVDSAAQFLVLSVFDFGGRSGCGFIDYGGGGGDGYDHVVADLVDSERTRTTCR